MYALTTYLFYKNQHNYRDLEMDREKKNTTSVWFSPYETKAKSSSCVCVSESKFSRYRKRSIRFSIFVDCIQFVLSNIPWNKWATDKEKQLHLNTNCLACCGFYTICMRPLYVLLVFVVILTSGGVQSAIVPYVCVCYRVFILIFFLLLHPVPF